MNLVCYFDRRDERRADGNVTINDRRVNDIRMSIKGSRSKPQYLILASYYLCQDIMVLTTCTPKNRKPSRAHWYNIWCSLATFIFSFSSTMMGTDATLTRKQETNHQKTSKQGEKNRDERESVPYFDKKMQMINTFLFSMAVTPSSHRTQLHITHSSSLSRKYLQFILKFFFPLPPSLKTFLSPPLH